MLTVEFTRDDDGAKFTTAEKLIVRALISQRFDMHVFRVVDAQPKQALKTRDFAECAVRTQEWVDNTFPELGIVVVFTGVEPS